jgi:hypothetical protein
MLHTVSPSPAARAASSCVARAQHDRSDHSACAPCRGLCIDRQMLQPGMLALYIDCPQSREAAERRHFAE